MHVNNINPNQLQNEFTFNNIKTISFINDRKDNYIAANAWIEFEPDTNMELVCEIIKNHKPKELEIDLTAEEKIKKLEETIKQLSELLKSQ